MSVLWEKSTGDTHYSVRRSGGSIRLYTNRVFHSQWNPKQPFSGGIWDCLSLPAFHMPVGHIKRVLLLGVGGGAVIRQLELIDAYPEITAVEIDEQHINIAREWFDVTGGAVSLIHANAIDWLNLYEGPRFDLIIEDLFGHDAGEPVRACALEPQWIELLRSRLNKGGLLVLNCIDSRELLDALPAIGAAGFSSGFRWHLPNYENIIGVFSDQTLHTRQWSRHLELSDLPANAKRQARSIVRRPLRGLELYRD